MYVGRRHESSKTRSDAFNKLYEINIHQVNQHFSLNLPQRLQLPESREPVTVSLYTNITTFGCHIFLPKSWLLSPHLILILFWSWWDNTNMIESSRRKILDTLNSRYIYKRVVRFLMYIHNTIFILAIASLRQRLNIHGGFVQIATILGLWQGNTLTSLPSTITSSHYSIRLSLSYKLQPCRDW